MKISTNTFTLLLLATSLASGANIVVNGDFETGTLAGWTSNPNSNHAWGIAASDVLDGSYSAETGCVGPQCVDATNLGSAASLDQMLSTTAGDQYQLTFLFQGDGAPEDLVVLWGGQVVDDLCPTAGNCSGITNGSGFQSYTVTGLVATSASTDLMFLGRQDPGYDRLDDIEVTDSGSAAAAPEPATLSLGLLGLVAYVVCRKYQNS